MLIIDLRAFIFKIFIITIIMCGTFYIISDKKIKWYYLVSIFFMMFFFRGVLGDWIDIIVLSLLFIYRRFIKHRSNFFIENSFLITILISMISALIASSIINPLVSFKGEKGFDFVLIELVCYIVLIMVFLKIYNIFNLRLWLKKNDSLLLTGSLLYVYCMGFFLMLILRELKIYEVLVSAILIFSILQSILVSSIFLHDRKKRQQQYEALIFQNKLDNLKDYTEQLEEDYRMIRKFKHDYKNLILSLNISIENKDYEQLSYFIKELEIYSEKHLNNSTMDVFKDLSNIQNDYLKSLFISKLQLILKEDISCQFECCDFISEFYINIMDMIRLISISLDNAIEAAMESKERQVNIAIIKIENSLVIKIENSYLNYNDPLAKLMKEGYSTKENHSGVGLSTIQEIKNKHSNLFIQYQKSEKFIVHIIVNEGGSE